MKYSTTKTFSSKVPLKANYRMTNQNFLASFSIQNKSSIKSKTSENALRQDGQLKPMPAGKEEE